MRCFPPCLSTALFTLFIATTFSSVAFSQDCIDLGLDTLALEIQISPAGPYNSGDDITVDILVNNFVDVAVLNAVFNWDPTVLCFKEEMGNPLINPSFPLSVTSVGNSGGDLVKNGKLPFGYLLPTLDGVTVPDGTVILSFDLEICGEGLDCAAFSLSNDPGDNIAFHTLANGSECTQDTIPLLLDADDSFCIECGTDIMLIDEAYCLDDVGHLDFEFSVCGGTAPYDWSMVEGTASVILSGTLNSTGDIATGNLPPGAYQVVILDALGAMLPDLGVFLITTDFEPIDVTLTETPPICSNGSGTLDYAITGGGTLGFATYDIVLSDGTRSTNDRGIGSFTLLNGDYDITITDDQGCSIVRSISWDIPPIEYTIVEQDSAACLGASDGMIRVVATGGTPMMLTNGNPGYRFNGSNDFIDTFTIMSPMDSGIFIQGVVVPSVVHIPVLSSIVKL